jgi:hypothetical protein
MASHRIKSAMLPDKMTTGARKSRRVLRKYAMPSVL